MATFRKTKSGKVEAQVKFADGTTKTRTLPNRPTAEIWARGVETERDTGTLRTGRQDKVTCGEQWVTFRRIREGVLSPATNAKNESTWRLHLEPAFAAVPIRDMRRSRVEAWVVEKAASGTGTPTLEAAVKLLSTLMESAVDDDLISANPLRKVRIPAHVPARRRFVTAAEVDAVIAEVEAPDHRLLLELLAGTGLRIGEALGLRAMDVGPGGSTVSVHRVWTRSGYKSTPKSDASVRTVPVPVELRAALVAQVRSSLPATPVFQGDDRNISRRVLQPACKAAGVEVFSLHSLRHHYTSVLVASGLPLFEVAKAIGHVDTVLVERVYGHLTPGAHDRLLAAQAGTLR